MKKNIVLLFGGGGTEHEISVISKQYLRAQIDENQYNIIEVEITHLGEWTHLTDKVEVNFKGELVLNEKSHIPIDLVIPCIHGFPGETGDVQSFLEMVNIPYIGCNSETSKICFNKIMTKLWLESYGIATTPFLPVSQPSQQELQKIHDFFKKHGHLFIKASNQGSSVGCFPVQLEEEIDDTIIAAFALSPYVVVEKEVRGRELEVSVFEYNDEIHATIPGEIICPSSFYSYDEKYNSLSQTETIIEAKNITREQTLKISEIARQAFLVLKLRHLARIDFFLTYEGEIYINEVNTFPGMTPISMFPKMMENYGVSFKDFLAQIIAQTV